MVLPEDKIKIFYEELTVTLEDIRTNNIRNDYCNAMETSKRSQHEKSKRDSTGIKQTNMETLYIANKPAKTTVSRKVSTRQHGMASQRKRLTIHWQTYFQQTKEEMIFKPSITNIQGNTEIRQPINKGEHKLRKKTMIGKPSETKKIDIEAQTIADRFGN